MQTPTPTPRTDDLFRQRDGESRWEHIVRQRQSVEALERELAAASLRLADGIADGRTWVRDIIEERNTLREQLAEAIRRDQRLADAVAKTLADNAHLADGDQCTLRELREALAEWRAGE